MGQKEIASTCGSAVRCCRVRAEKIKKTEEETGRWRRGKEREVKEEYIITWQS